MHDSGSPDVARDAFDRTGELQHAVTAIIARKKKLDAASIHLDSSFQELGIDSLDGIDLVFTFEDTYNINIPDHVVQQMKTIREVVDALHREIDKQPRPAA
jgi:acyl carrier protein